MLTDFTSTLIKVLDKEIRSPNWAWIYGLVGVCGGQ